MNGRVTRKFFNADNNSEYQFSVAAAKCPSISVIRDVERNLRGEASDLTLIIGKTRNDFYAQRA